MARAGDAKARALVVAAALAIGSGASFGLAAEPPWAPCGAFVRGDANADGDVDVSDAVFVLLYLFSGAAIEPACMDAMDANDDESVAVADAVAILRCLFQRGGPLPGPFPEPGTDEPCNGHDDDGDGSTDEGCPRNEKDPSRYPDGLVFLVSDRVWEDVLELVPAASWSGSAPPCPSGAGAAPGTCACPLLVFHEEATAFDADAILDFLGRFRPARLRIAGSPPEGLIALLLSDAALGLAGDEIELFSGTPVAAHWREIHRAVAVRRDFEEALLASAIASLLDAPLLIEGREAGFDLAGTSILCVGDPAGPCDERLSAEEARARYLELTGTDRALLVRPDLGTFRSDVKTTSIGAQVRELFGRTALAAAALAAYKRELPIPVHARGADEVDGELRAALDRLGWSPSYLTIAASPLEIQQTILFQRSGGSTVTWSIDATRYGNADLDAFGFAERKTGRIYGFTSSDVSAWVARTVFYDRLGFSGTCLFTGQGVGASDQRARALAGLFDRTGHPSTYRTYANPATPEDWKRKVLINVDAHGSPYYATISASQIPPLEGALVLTASCLTCAFDRLTPGNYGQLFCLELIRKGALGAVVSVDTAGFTWDSTRLNGALSGDLGTMFLEMQNADHARNVWYIRDLLGSDDFGDLRADIQFLLGDPTLALPLGDPILPAREREIAAGPDAIEILFRIRSINLEDGGTVFTFVEGTDDLIQARWARFFLEAGPLSLFDDYAVESPDVDPMFFGGLKLVAVQRRADGDHAHFLTEKDLASKPLDAVAETEIRVRILRR